MLDRTQLREYSGGYSSAAVCGALRGTEGHSQHRRRRAAAAAHLDETQEVDRRGVQLLRLGVREQRRPGSVALDRRELHTPMFRSFGGGVFSYGKRSAVAFCNEKTQKAPTRSARGRTSNVAAMRGLACDATREVRLSGRERCIRSAS